MLEKEFQEAVRNLAVRFGWLCYHTHRSDRSEPGFPDLVLVRAPRLIFAELKSAKGRMSVPQLIWHGALSGTAAEAYVWRPADLEAIAVTLSKRYLEGPPYDDTV